MPDEVIRKRMKRHEIPDGVRYVTFSCFGRLPLMGHPAIRDVMQEGLYQARARFGFELFAWVIMPEHSHVLIRPRSSIPMWRSLRWIKQSTAERVVGRWRELGVPVLRRITRRDGSVQFWLPGGGFDRNIRDVYEFGREVRYVHRNPVERGLVPRAEDWAWSSVRWWMYGLDRRVECDPPPEPQLAWHLWKGYK